MYEPENDPPVGEIIDRLERVMSDTSVSPEETAERLQAVKDHADMLLSTLRDDGVDC